MPKKSTTLEDLAQLTQYMQDLQHPMKDLIETLRELIKSVHPDIKERIKWNAPSYYFGETDFLTFGPPARKKDQVMLVFHHPYIVQIKSKLLEGNYKDRRLMTFSNSNELHEKEQDLKAILNELLEKV
jgi:hypothetical protein